MADKFYIYKYKNFHGQECYALHRNDPTERSSDGFFKQKIIDKQEISEELFNTSNIDQIKQQWNEGKLDAVSQ